MYATNSNRSFPSNRTISSNASGSGGGGGGPKTMMNSYFASKGLDMTSPTRATTNSSSSSTSRSKKISTGSSIVRGPIPTCKIVNKYMNGKLIDAVKIYFERKVDKTKNDLIAVFELEKGMVTSYHIYFNSEDISNTFELTERRRQLLFRYYNRGNQLVILYFNLNQSENYLPINSSALQKLLPKSPQNNRTNRSVFGKSKSMTSSLEYGGAKDKELSRKSKSVSATGMPTNHNRKLPPKSKSANHCSSSTSSSTQSTNSSSTFAPPQVNESAAVQMTSELKQMQLCSSDTHDHNNCNNNHTLIYNKPITFQCCPSSVTFQCKSIVVPSVMCNNDSSDTNNNSHNEQPDSSSSHDNVFVYRSNSANSEN